MPQPWLAPQLATAGKENPGMKKEAQVNTTSAGAGWKLPEFDLVVKRSKTSGKGLQVTVITAK